MSVYADYLPGDGFTTLNAIYTAGSLVLGTALRPFIWNVVRSYPFGTAATVDDPLGPRELSGVGNVVSAAKALLHTALSPNPIDPPAFELHYPHTARRFEDEAHATLLPSLRSPERSRPHHGTAGGSRASWLEHLPSRRRGMVREGMSDTFWLRHRWTAGPSFQRTTVDLFRQGHIMRFRSETWRFVPGSACRRRRRADAGCTAVSAFG